MGEEGFYEAVRQDISLDSIETTRQLTIATLQTLGERITDGSAAVIAEQLPEPLAHQLVNGAPGEAESFPLSEFLARVHEIRSVGARN